MSVRATLQGLADQGDEDSQAELDAASTPPEGTEYLLEYFEAIALGRPTNGMGVCRLPRAEIQAWQEGEGFRLNPWEVRAIVGLDAIWCAVQAGNSPPPEPSSTEETMDAA